MLADTVGLHDVEDVEAFVQATINRARLILSVEEREELVGEGIAIMFTLGAQFQPRMDGHDQDGRFSGFAAQFLPRKLGDAWHRMHPEHQLRTQPDGKRRWEYLERTVSLEAITADDPDRHPVLAGCEHDEEPLSIEGLLRAHLEARMTRDLTVAGLLAEGCTPSDCAGILGLTSDQVREALSDLEPIALRLRALNQR